MHQKRIPIFECAAAILAVGLVAALTALPSSNSSRQADIQTMDNLGLLRASIFRFSMEHSDLDGALWPGQNDLNFEQQLLGPSRANGTVFEPDCGREDRWHGPYLESFPTNPHSGLSNVRLVSGSGSPKLTGDAGWVYQPETGKAWPDLPGQDLRGVLYAEY